MIKPPYVSIIIPTYNGIHLLPECLDSILNQEYPRENLETIVVDNASKDGSLNLLKKRYPWVSTIRLTRNIGFAANNIGVEASHGEYIIFLNHDIKAGERWLPELVKAAISTKSDVCGSKILFYEEPETVNYAGGKLTLIGVGIEEGLGEKQSRNEKGKIVGCVSGASMLIRKDVFKKLEGFDKDYFLYFEDVDLCWRAWIQGYKVFYTPRSIIYHKQTASTAGGRSYLRSYHCYRNQLMNIFKNLEALNIFKGLVVSTLYFALKTLLSLKTKSTFEVKALINANRWCLLNLKKIYVKRLETQLKRERRDRYLFEHKLIASFKELILEYLRLRRSRFAPLYL